MANRHSKANAQPVVQECTELAKLKILKISRNNRKPLPLICGGFSKEKKGGENMSPFYLKEGETWEEWTGLPTDLSKDNGNSSGVSMYSVKDPEQAQVTIQPRKTVYVREEDGGVFFPNQTKEPMIINRRGFDVINASTGRTEARVIYSAEPIK